MSHAIVRRGRLILVALASSSVLATPLYAQSALQVGATVGYYHPVGRFDRASIYSMALPRTPSDLSGPAWGANTRLWLGRRFGVEATGMFVRTKVGGGMTPEGWFPARAARVLTVAAEALYDLSPRSGGYRAWVGAGPGLVRHSGAAYARFGSFTDLAGVIDGGVGVRLSSHVDGVGELGAVLYDYDIPMPYDLRLNPGEMQSGFQEDLSLRFGVEWTPR